MNRDEAIEKLGISLSTFKRWCKAIDLEINKSGYADEDLKKLEAVRDKVRSLGWDGFLESIGKKTVNQAATSGIVQRYLPTRQEAKAIAQGAILAFDAMVAEEFSELAKKPSPIFSGLFKGLTGQRIIEASLGDSDALYFLEGEIVDD